MPSDEAPIRIERFDPSRHDREGFDCGVERLNNFLKLTAKTQQEEDMTRVYVAVEDGAARVLGYHALNIGTMNVDELKKRPRGAPKHGDLPVVFLGQVAVDNDAQGSGIGGILLHHALRKACGVADEVGCYAIILDVLSDGGADAFERRKSWYATQGFLTFASNPARMFLTMKQARAMTQFA